MATRVVNVRREPCDVYVGRPGHGQDGYFGNPYRRGAICGRCGRLHELPGDTEPCFKAYFRKRILKDPEYLRRVLELEGKALGCFCVPWHWCHGYVYAAFLDAYRAALTASCSGPTGTGTPGPRTPGSPPAAG